MRLITKLRCLTLLMFLGTCLSTVYLMLVSGSSTPSSNCKCLLPCDVSKFAGHTSVIYRLEPDFEQKIAVSDLLENGKCSVRVPDCTVKEKPFVLKINSDSDERVSDILLSESYSEPDCHQEKATLERSVLNGVTILSGNLLLVLMCILLFM